MPDISSEKIGNSCGWDREAGSGYYRQGSESIGKTIQGGNLDLEIFSH